MFVFRSLLAICFRYRLSKFSTDCSHFLAPNIKPSSIKIKTVVVEFRQKQDRSKFFIFLQKYIFLYLLKTFLHLFKKLNYKNEKQNYNLKKKTRFAEMKKTSYTFLKKLN